MLIITFVGTRKKVLDSIVLGQIPGTHIQMDFAIVLNVVGGMFAAWFIFVLIRRALRRSKDAVIELHSIELISL